MLNAKDLRCFVGLHNVVKLEERRLKLVDILISYGTYLAHSAHLPKGLLLVLISIFLF